MAAGTGGEREIPGENRSGGGERKESCGFLTMNRVAIEVLAPAVLGPGIMAAMLCRVEQPNLAMVAFIWGVGFLWTLALSVPYMGVMEWVFSRGLRPDSWASVALSTVVGMGCGIGFGLFLGHSVMGWLVVLGAVVGLVTGLLVFYFHPNDARRGTEES